jgi:hypothetical protein
MIKMLLAATVVGALAYGTAAVAAPGGWPNDPGTGGGSGTNCFDVCPSSVTLPNGTYCVLDGCLDTGGDPYCVYSCYWGLPF